MHQGLTRAPRGAHHWLAAAGLCLASGAAPAADFALSGLFTQDDQISWLTLSVATAGTVSVTSLGYAGGSDSQGGVHLAGGFDSMLFLYDAAGTLVAQSDDGVAVPMDPLTGLAADAAFSINLSPGEYSLALTQYDNFALGDLPAGFSQAGAGNFTPSLSPNCTASAFCDWSGAGRTGRWVLDISGVSAVPEPGSLLLWLAGLAGVAGLTAWRRRPSAS